MDDSWEHLWSISCLMNNLTSRSSEGCYQRLEAAKWHNTGGNELRASDNGNKTKPDP